MKTLMKRYTRFIAKVLAVLMIVDMVAGNSNVVQVMAAAMPKFNTNTSYNNQSNSITGNNYYTAEDGSTYKWVQDTATVDKLVEKGHYVDVKEWVPETYKNVQTWVNGYYKDVQKWVQATTKTVQKWVPATYKMVQEWVPATYKDVQKWVPAAYKTVQNWIPATYKTAQRWIDGYYKTVENWVPTTYKTVQNWVPATYKTVENWVPTTYKTVQNWVPATYKMVENWVPATYRTVQKWVPGYYRSVRKYVPPVERTVTNKVGKKYVTTTETTPGYYTTSQEYVSGHYESSQEYVPGHYESSQQYVAGHYEDSQICIPGHYESSQQYVAGHYEDSQICIPGHYESSQQYVAGRYESYQQYIAGYYEASQQYVAGHYVAEKQYVAGYFEAKQQYVAGHYESFQQNIAAHYEVAKEWVPGYYKTTKEKVSGYYKTVKKWVADRYEKVQVVVGKHKELVSSVIHSLSYPSDRGGSTNTQIKYKGLGNLYDNSDNWMTNKTLVKKLISLKEQVDKKDGISFWSMSKEQQKIVYDGLRMNSEYTSEMDLFNRIDGIRAKYNIPVGNSTSFIDGATIKGIIMEEITRQAKEGWKKIVPQYLNNIKEQLLATNNSYIDYTDLPDQERKAVQYSLKVHQNGDLDADTLNALENLKTAFGITTSIKSHPYAIDLKTINALIDRANGRLKFAEEHKTMSDISDFMEDNHIGETFYAFAVGVATGRMINMATSKTVPKAVETVTIEARAIGIADEAQLAKIGENTAKAVSNGSKFTKPTLAEGGVPKGKYEVPDINDPRPITRQNKAADLLANKGYDVEMLPYKTDGNGYGLTPTANPDFKINGEIFDCYSPDTSSVRNIWTTVQQKTLSQAKRIVINLDDFPGSLDDLGKQFYDWPIDSLNELLIMKNGKISRLFIR